MLLDKLIRDEKIINRSLYSSGPYWDYKNSRAILEIKKKGLGDFRGSSAGIGTSFADNIPSDIRNEFNIKGRIIGKIFSLPILNKVFNGQLNLTQNYINDFIKNQAIVYQNNKNVENLINKYHFKNDFEILSILRNLKIIGIFTRLAVRDGKKNYLKLIPNAWDLINIRINENDIFNDLKDLLNQYFKGKIK